MYPPHLQACRVTSSTISGPTGASSALGPSMYLSYTQQVRGDYLTPRDREPCLVMSLDGSALTAGYYLCRLVGSYTDLPVYAAIPAAAGGSGITSINDDTTVSQTIGLGTAGTDINLATTGVAYNAGTTYSRGMIATSGGSTYRYINATPTAGNAPPNATYWVDVTGDGLTIVNIPDASGTADGIVTIGNQSLGSSGTKKTFLGSVEIRQDLYLAPTTAATGFYASVDAADDAPAIFFQTNLITNAAVFHYGHILYGASYYNLGFYSVGDFIYYAGGGIGPAGIYEFHTAGFFSIGAFPTGNAIRRDAPAISCDGFVHAPYGILVPAFDPFVIAPTTSGSVGVCGMWGTFLGMRICNGMIIDGTVSLGTIGKASGGTGEDNSTGGTANTFWARPDGATGAASYRAIVGADLPIGSAVQAWSSSLDDLAAVTPIADNTYTVGARLTPGGTDGTITTSKGLITAITEAT